MLIEVENLDDSRLDAYVRLTDTQLRSRLEPDRGIFIAESCKVIERALDAGFEPLSVLTEPKWMERMPHMAEHAQAVGLPVFVAAHEQMERIAGYEVTRGALAAFRRPALPPVEEVVAGARRVAILEDITNHTNVGAIFRSAAALGIDGILVTPGCFDPLYRRAIRVSMGAVFKVPWACIGADVEGAGMHGNVRNEGGWSTTGIPLLRSLGFKTAAMALSPDAIALDDPSLRAIERLAIILGTEGSGLAARTLRAVDHVVMIPMSHGVDSLNVAAASAVAFWELRCR